MNNTCSLTLLFLVAFACLFPASANAQMPVYYDQYNQFHDQSLALLPVDSYAGNSIGDAPLTFAQANMYSLPRRDSQENMYSQPMTFSQANAYTQPQAYWQSNSAPQPNITWVSGQNRGISSSIPADTFEIATPQVPVYSPPVLSHSPQPVSPVCTT